MRLRWNFHRLMLGQSMAFYQDEFAGRITAKVMQTALAVRDTIFMLADVLVGDGRLLRRRMIVLAGGFDRQLMLPFLAWLALLRRCAAATSCRAWARSARRRPMRAR